MSIIEKLYDVGLIQFGYFEQKYPYQILLNMLPSYPQLLQELAQIMSESVLKMGCDRMTCQREMIPIATVVSLISHIPLVYEYDNKGTASHDLIGAYDVGHPTVWLTEIPRVDDKFVKRCDGVGLMIQQQLSVYAISAKNGVLFSLYEIVETLDERKRISEIQAKNLTLWLKTNTAP
jgi:hypothetical protein